jgi:hypothetical protein
MRSKVLCIVYVLFLFGTILFAQNPDLPALQVGSLVKVTMLENLAVVQIPPQYSSSFSGTITIRQLNLSCNPSLSSNPYPTGNLVFTVDLSDTSFGSVFDVIVTKPIQLTYVGQVAPTTFFSAMCDMKNEKTPKGYLWMLFSDNNGKTAAKPSQDIVSFVLLDPHGSKIAYGTGTVIKGNIVVAP